MVECESPLSETLTLVVAGRAEEAARALVDRTESTARSMQAFAYFWLGQFDRSSEAADRALTSATTDEERALALATRALATAGTAPTETNLVVEAVAALDSFQPDTPERALIGYLVAEAALAHAQLDEAVALHEWVTRAARLWEPHPFAALMHAAAVRIVLFEGRVAEAEAAMPDLHAAANTPATKLLGGAVESLVRGNAADIESTQQLLTAIINADVNLADHLGRGILLLGAFGALAVGDAIRSADLILAAGRDAGLSAFTVIDRALGLEVLVVGSIESGDADAAHAWAAQADALAEHPIAGPTVDRLRARIALLNGENERAIELAERSALACRKQRRVIEAAESEVVLGRARIADHNIAAASRTLRELVAEADLRGHRSVRLIAGQELSRIQRRLPPVAGQGWSGLSDRETQITNLILQGNDTVPMARALGISPHTVRVHTSRILAAFGVGTRIQLVARFGETLPESTSTTDQLTPRQREVVSRAADGASNAEIAAELGIGVKAVEKHLAAASERLGARSRLDLITRWRAPSGSETR
jgi:DNA-binding CsgD family transcriptional regulator